MTEPPDEERSAATASTAGHLADLEARYDTHLAAVRKSAADLHTGLADDAEALFGAGPNRPPEPDLADP